MLRREFLSLLTAASITPAQAEETDQGDAALSEEWKKRTRLYVKAVTRAIEIKGKDFPRPVSSDLTGRVLARVRALQRKGWSTEAIRDLFPFEADAVKASIDGREVRVFKTGFARDGFWFCAGGYTEKPKAWIVDPGGLRRLTTPADIQTIGASKDGKTLAVVTQDLTVSLCETDFGLRRARAFALPKTITRNGKTVPAYLAPGDVDTLIPFDDGRALAVSGHGGQVLLREGEIVPLEQDEGERRIDMAHIDLSRDQRRIALGHQDSLHYVVDLDGRLLAKLDPVSSYPHCAIFNDGVGQVAFNSCHFYNGGTLGLDFGAFDPAKTLAGGDPGVTELDADDRVYAGIAYRDGYIWGHAYGYVRHVNAKGQTVWHHHVGGTITSVAINREETLLAVATYAGFVALIDLESAGENEFAIGTGRFREAMRYVVLSDEAAPIRW